MSGTAAPLFDVRDPAFLANPYPVFHKMRAFAPMFKAPNGRLFITKYDDTQVLLRDKRFGKDFDNPETLAQRFGPNAMQEPAVAGLSHMMLMRDPPDHTRLRGLVNKAFTARRIEAMRGWVQGLTDRLLDKVMADGRMDLVRDLAFPLPVLVICELLGIPEEDQANFVNGSASGGALLNPTPPTREEIDRANEGSLASSKYFSALFERRRREPRDDLITQLVQAEEAGDRLTTEELQSNVQLLFGAGHETTVNLIGNGFLNLLRNPDQWNRLREEPSLIPNAIEEILRFESPVQAVGRTALLHFLSSNPAVGPTAIRRCLRIRTRSTLPGRIRSRCPSAAESTSASAPSWRGSRRPWCLKPRCAGCRTCGWHRRNRRNGAPASHCAA